MIAVLDFGSQYTHLITTRLRKIGVNAEIFSPDISAAVLKSHNPHGIILSGGPSSVYDKGAPTLDKKIYDLNIPILGICYGLHLIARDNGGRVVMGKRREYGEKIISISGKTKLFSGLSERETVWFSHGDQVTKLPEGFTPLAATSDCLFAAFSDEKRKIYALQFHPEAAHTKSGVKILKNFSLNICSAPIDWKIKDLKTHLISSLKMKIGYKQVMIGVSGGVDSLVAAVLLNHAIGDNLYPIFIDTGLLRKNEVKEVSKLFKNLKFKNFTLVNAGEEFLNGLKNISDPEEKRKKFASIYFKIFKKQAEILKKEKKITYLAQGTIYPDRIEAGQASKMAAVIKTHHNLHKPSNFNLELIEPLENFYKDEVRQLGVALGLAKDAVYRHPFPGPGLAIRVLGEVTKERLDLLREADSIFIDELKKSGWYSKIWQAFAAVIPVRSVGVMGDSRTYHYILTLRAVTSSDAMTADWARIPEHLLNQISKRITNEVYGINRVLYDITQKPPATIEYE